VYSRLPAFVLGFHGCDHSVAAAVVSKREQLKPSQNKYDWLGAGIYFWENNSQRAIDFAAGLQRRRRRGKRTIRNPSSIGAVIDLGLCLNLLDARYLKVLQQAFRTLEQTANDKGQELPENRPLTGGAELLLRDLDCAVINTVHALREQDGLPPFDTVRSAFIEGPELYPGSTFREKNHIQICVRNPKCIKGYFWPQEGTGDEGVVP
jgi:hypothetical protein